MGRLGFFGRAGEGAAGSIGSVSSLKINPREVSIASPSSKFGSRPHSEVEVQSGGNRSKLGTGLDIANVAVGVAGLVLTGLQIKQHSAAAKAGNDKNSPNDPLGLGIDIANPTLWLGCGICVCICIVMVCLLLVVVVMSSKKNKVN